MKYYLAIWIFLIAVLSTFVYTDKSLGAQQALLKLQSIQKILGEELEDEDSMYDIISEMRQQIQQLEKGQHHLKSQLHSMKQNLNDVQTDSHMYRDALKRAEIKITEACGCGVDNRLVRKVLKQCKHHGIRRKTDNANAVDEVENLKVVLETLNSSCQHDVKQTLSVQHSATTSAPERTTLKSVEPTVMKRIIIVPYREDRGEQSFKQLNIHNNTVSNYPFRYDDIISVCFVERQQRLLFGQHRESKIIYNNLDSSNSDTLIGGVTAFGMVVDEEQELLFLAELRTMEWPQGDRGMSAYDFVKRKNSYRRIPYISRMSTTGGKYTLLRNLSSEDSSRLNIAVNTRQKEIYVSGDRKLFVLTYDGNMITDFDTKNYAPVLTFDNARGILYFNMDNMLTKVSMSDRVVLEVTTLPVKPFSLAYYNNTVYYGGIDGTGYVGSVHHVNNKLSNDRPFYYDFLQLRTRSLIICLVP